MKIRIGAVALFAVVITLSAVTRTTCASGWVEVTGCDSVLILGNYHPRVTFSIHNAFPYPYYPIYSFRLVSDGIASTPDTCAAITTFSPTDWVEVHQGSIGGLSNLVFRDTSFVGGFQHGILQGETVDGFQLVMTGAHPCCYNVYFYGAFFDPFAQDRICFECDRPVPARHSSWGQLKALYR